MDFSPVALANQAFDYVAPYLPWYISYPLRGSLKSISSLPPSLANTLPLLISLFAIYTAVTSAYSTARYAMRTTWWLVKWGSLAAVVAWFFGGGERIQNGLMSGMRGAMNRADNGFYGETAQRAASAAAGSSAFSSDSWQDYAAQAANSVLGGGNGEQGGLQGFLSKNIPGMSYLQNPAKAILGEVITFLSPDDPSYKKSSSSNSKRTTRQSEREQRERKEKIDEQIGNVGETAGKLFEGIKGKAWEAFSDAIGGKGTGNGDRWSESRNRQKDSRNR